MAEYALSQGGYVIRTADGALIPDDPGNVDRQAYEVWVAEGGVPDPVPEKAVTVADYQVAIEALVHATARERSYGDAVSCASYVASTVATWAAEAQAFVAWRDAVWVAVYAAIAEFEAGGPAPTIEALIASLPPMAWPA